VARWWDRSVAAVVVTASRRWPRLAFDRRDRRLHQLIVIAYSRHGSRSIADRLVMFVTAVRETKSGRWRLLEANQFP
jgi:hypothetical protein